jgi:hypothetical protein
MKITVNLTPDVTPPRVVRVAPEHSELVPLETDTLFVFFSEPMDPRTLDGTSLFVVFAGTDNIPGTADDVPLTTGIVSYRDTPAVGVISFPGPLSLGVYRGVVSTKVSDLAGNRLATNFTWSFAILSGGPDDDQDGDDVTNGEELQRGTNPFLADTTAGVTVMRLMSQPTR